MGVHVVAGNLLNLVLMLICDSAACGILVNASRMLPPRKLHWLAKQALDWSGLVQVALSA